MGPVGFKQPRASAPAPAIVLSSVAFAADPLAFEASASLDYRFISTLAPAATPTAAKLSARSFVVTIDGSPGLDDTGLAYYDVTNETSHHHDREQDHRRLKSHRQSVARSFAAFAIIDGNSFRAAAPRPVTFTCALSR